MQILYVLFTAGPRMLHPCRLLLLSTALLLFGAGCAREPGIAATAHDFNPADWVDLARQDRDLKLDVRYATSNNFTGTPLYDTPRAFMHRLPAEALLRAQRRVHAAGYSFIVWDAYRPWAITKLFWERFPKVRSYLVDPVQGSKHNRGFAIDLTLYELQSGREVVMPSGYDDFSERAHPNYRGGTAEQRRTRDLLRSAMEAEGFTVDPVEWWHYNFKGWEQYPLLDISLRAMAVAIGPS